MIHPQVSVIVPVYKTENYLDQCIESIIQQTFQNFEIIIVDDGSPDACPKMCDLWATRDERVKVIHKENGGVSSARNAGIMVARGEYIVFVDSDDIISSRMLEVLLKTHPNQTTLAAVSMQRISEELPVDSNDAITIETAGKTDFARLRGGMFACGALYNRSIIEHEGLLFSEKLNNLEDVLWNMIYFQYVDDVAVTSNQLYYYRHNPSSITSHCVDRAWQVQSWCKVRSELGNWVLSNNSTKPKRKVFRRPFRHCQNNIHAECLAGNISYKHYRLIDREACNIQQTPFYSFASLPERCILYLFPRCYFVCYKCLLHLKGRLKGRK